MGGEKGLANTGGKTPEWGASEPTTPVVYPLRILQGKDPAKKEKSKQEPWEGARGKFSRAGTTGLATSPPGEKSYPYQAKGD